MENTDTVAVENLSISFGKFDVVRNLSFRIEAGRTMALVGESGSGKSVTSLAIMRLLPEAGARITGSICLGDRELTALPEREMRRVRGGGIAMIFQEPMTSLNPVQRIGDQIGEAIRIHRGLTGRALREAVLEMLRKVRIPDPERRIDEYPHTFSGGMRQRVVIAMAIACKPSLIIADEPTTALDVTVQAQTLALLKDLQRETGAAILFITHDMGVVAEVADHVLVMKKGEAVEYGAVHDIFTRPQSPYTRTLIEAAPTVALSAQADEATLAPSDGPSIACKGYKPVLVVRDMVVRFPRRGGLLRRVDGAVHAVEKVSFAIGERETLGVVGESGSGKSTIGKAIIDLARMQSGSVRIGDHAVDYADPRSLARLRRDVQMIFQDPFGSLDTRQTIGSAIMEPMIVHRVATGAQARRRMEALLERVGLDPARASSLPHEFSGGQRQRICIARALAMEPKLIIADESVSALDVTIKGQIIDLMIDIQRDLGVSYLFISHDMAAVERICDRVAVMYYGEIVEIGPRDDVIGRPRHDYTRRLLSAIPIVHPDQRGSRTADFGSSAEPRSPVKPVGYEAPPAVWAQSSADHFVRRDLGRTGS